MSQGDEGPQRVENNARVHDMMHVKFSEELDRRYTLLVVLEVVVLV
jgi:hypothetical protein